MENITRIIQGCIQKDHKYQKIVYEQYRGYSLKIVFRYIYRYEQAIDVMNDGFVKLFNHFDRFVPARDEEGNEKVLMAYLKRIMINTAIDELRRKKLVPEIGGIPEYVWESTDKRHDADQLMLYKDIIILVKELPPQYRMVFNLYVIDGYNHLEIADLLQISPSASKSTLSRARGLLQKNIIKMEESRVCRI